MVCRNVSIYDPVLDPSWVVTHGGSESGVPRILRTPDRGQIGGTPDRPDLDLDGPWVSTHETSYLGLVEGPLLPLLAVYALLRNNV